MEKKWESKDSKISRISTLLETETLNLTKNISNWQKYLETAAKFYKYTFTDQVLLSAQAPNATQCATFSQWTETVGRGIRQGSKGIPLLEEKDGRKDIKYVFDISATYISKRSRNVKLWDMNAAEPIAERLSEAYRYDKNTFYGIISQRADEILKTNIKKYLGELTNKKENSLLEELDEPHIEVRFAKIVKESLMFSILTRCGLEAELDEEIMWHMGDFNTIPVISQLGAAVSEISSTILREIEREVRAYNRSQNTEELSGIAEKQTGSAGLFLGNEKENNYEQRENYQRNATHLQRNGTEVSANVRGGEQSDIQTGQRNNDISSSVGNRRGETLRPDYVGKTQTGIPERGKAGDISGTYDKRSVGTSGGNGQSSKRDGGQAFGGDEQSRGNNGRTESQRPNEVGRAPQQSEKQSKGNSVQRTDIHLNSSHEAEDKSPAFFDTEKNQNSIIGNTPYRSISDKVYRKLSVDAAETLIDMLGGTDIKYSGKQNDDNTITFNFSKGDMEQADKYISEAKASNKKGFSKDEVEIAKNTDLVAFLSSRGEHLKKIGREYTLAEHDSMRINGNQFYWNSRNVGGNAVSFCMEYYGMDFKSAVAQLLQFNGYNVELQNNNRQSTTVQKEEPRETEEHKPLLNPLDDKTNRVYAYLTKTRGISEDTVKRFLDEGIIKQDIKGNAVFLTFDKDNNLSGAELSGTLSDKKYKNSTERNGNGFTINPKGDNKPEKVMFFESAIDALSYYDMHRDTNALLVSMAGLKDNVVLNTLEKYGLSYENAIISSDNDEAGRNFAEKMKNNYGIPSYSIVDDELYKICGSESHKDWNDLLISYNEQQLTHTNELIKGIPKDIVIKALQRGTGFVGGKFRMEELYNTESEQKYRIAAIKKEYGTGGFAGGDKTIGEISEMEYSTKGCTIHWEGKSGTASGNLSWSDMDNVLKEIISNGLYITDEERNKYERSVFIREKVKLLHDGDNISVNGEKFTYKSRDKHNIIVVPDSPDSHIADYNEYYKNYMIGFYKLEKYDFEVLTEERAKEPNGHDQGDIIGNTPYRYVPKKKYRKLDLSAGIEISKKFDENGIKYSGRINDNNTLTLTFDGNKIDDVEKIINSLKPKEKANEETEFTALQEPDGEANKQEVIDSENIAKDPTEEEVLFGQADLAKFLAERTPYSDEWEDMAYPMFENGYLNTHKPGDKAIFGYNLTEKTLFDLARRYRSGDDIRRELALGLLWDGRVDDIEFVFEEGKISDRTFYYADDLRHSLHIEKTEDGFQCSFNDMERFVSLAEIGQAFLDRIHEEFEDLMYWRVFDYIRDDIPDISDETVQKLITAFDGVALPDWEKGDNQPKINRIKKALFDILGDEEQTEKVFACITKQKYNVSFEPEKQPDSLSFRFGKDGDDWISESELADAFVRAHPDCSFALGNAFMEYLDKKQHSERAIAELHVGYYKKTAFTISAVINGEEFNYEGRFDIGDGKGRGGGSLIDHIRDYNRGILEYTQCPFNQPEYKKTAQNTLDIFVPFLEAHSELTADEQQILNDFMEQYPIRTYEDIEKAQSRFFIYQLPGDNRYHGIRFESMKHLKANGIQLDLDDYKLVYEGLGGEFKGNATLEAIYTRFNIDRPMDFEGHSLSVSDVVVIETEGKQTAYYCDVNGFVEMPEFFREKELAQTTDRINYADKTPNTEKYRKETEKLFKPIQGLSAAEIEDIVKEDIANILSDNNIDVEITNVVVYGSRSRGIENKGSGLDIVLEYKGNYPEDSLFNLLNDEETGLDIGGIAVDINPIGLDFGNSLEDYLPKAEEYLKEKVKVIEQNKTIIDNLKVGDRIKLPSGSFEITRIDGDFSISMENIDKNSIVAKQGRMGHWKQRLLEETAGEPIQLLNTEKVLAETINSHLKFDLSGNGIKVIDTSKTNIFTGEYLNVAHISNEGAVKYLSNIVSDTDKKLIQAHADDKHSKFIKELHDHSSQEQKKETETYADSIETPNAEQNKTTNLTDEKVIQAISDKKDILVTSNRNSSESAIIKNARKTDFYNERLTYGSNCYIHLGNTDKSSRLILYSYKNTDAEEILKDLKDKGYTVSGIEEPEISIDNVPEIINFYRIGDFYEAYGTEAEKAAEILDLHTATKNGESMVGIPQHIAEEYSQKLKESGYSVNLSEETKLAAETKKSHLIAERNSAQIEQSLSETENNSSEISTRKAADFRITNLELGYGGQKEKYHMNIDAIKTLYTVESENRQATPQEQEILLKFVGWGGLLEVFDPNKQNWSVEYEELKALLPEKEYNAARASTMNAHYTSPTVINAIYKALSDMGFKGGRILDKTVSEMIQLHEPYLWCNAT